MFQQLQAHYHDDAWKPVPESLPVRGVWLVINALQAVWMALSMTGVFLLSMFIYAMTWSIEQPTSLARTCLGPIDLFLGFSRLDIQGSEKFPVGQPYLVMSNHQSMVDILIGWMACPEAVRFVGKKTLLYVPLVGLVMWAFGMVTIDRTNVKNAMRSLQKASKILAEKRRIVMVFPEGTRSRTGFIGEFKKGVFVLAMDAGVPIVPMALEGAATVAPRGRWHPRPACIRVRVGDPIPTAGLSSADREALMTRVRNAIDQLHRDCGGKGAAPLTPNASMSAAA